MIFNVRTGVIIIGLLLIIQCIWGCIGSVGILIILGTAEIDDQYFQPWYYFAEVLISFILAIKFCRLRSSEG